MARQSDSSVEEAVPMPDPQALLWHSHLAYAYLSLPDLQYRYVNPALARIHGVKISRTLGRTPEEVLGPELPARIRPAVEESIDNRRCRGEIEVEAAIAGRPGEKRAFRIAYYPVYAPDGEPTGVWFVVRDVTDRRLLARQQQRLMEIAQAVNEGIELPYILRMVRDTILETAPFDRVGLWLYDAGRGGMCGTWGTGRDGRATDESAEFFPLPSAGGHPLQRLLRGEVRFFLTPTYEFDPDPSPGVSMRGVGAHATIALRADDRVIGMLFVDNLLTDRPIKEEDLQTLLPCCEQAAVAIESARLRQAERQQTADLREAVRVTNHRVKNSLQVVVALVDMQLLEHEGPIDRASLERLKRQVRAMAAVHAFLGDVSPELDAPIREIVETLLPMLEVGDRIHCTLEAADAVLTVKQATAIVLILNELIENATAHGARNVDIAFRASAGAHHLEVSDDGPGFPPDFALSRDAHRGLHYVEGLTRWDLLGRVTFGNGPQGGAKVTVEF